MGGIRSTSVHFEQNPTQADIKSLLVEATGLPLYFEEFEDVLKVVHPTRPEILAWLSWADEDISKQIELGKQLGVDMRIKESFYENYSRCINVDFAAGDIDYIERSAIFVLKQLGGRTVEGINLPAWAGKKWEDVWPRSYLMQLRARCYGWFRNTLPD